MARGGLSARPLFGEERSVPPSASVIPHYTPPKHSLSRSLSLVSAFCVYAQVGAFMQVQVPKHNRGRNSTVFLQHVVYMRVRWCGCLHA